MSEGEDKESKLGYVSTKPLSHLTLQVSFLLQLRQARLSNLELRDSSQNLADKLELPSKHS